MGSSDACIYYAWRGNLQSGFNLGVGHLEINNRGPDNLFEACHSVYVYVYVCICDADVVLLSPRLLGK